LNEEKDRIHCLKGKFGENPTRSRHCKSRVIFRNHCIGYGKVRVMMILESGDLPMITMLFVSHEDEEVL